MEVSNQIHGSNFTPGEKPTGALHARCKRLGVFRSRSRHYGEQKNLLPLSGIEPRFLSLLKRNGKKENKELKQQKEVSKKGRKNSC
jgi:hypothetical protein